MIVTVNGEPREIPEGATIASLIDDLSAPPRGVAVAVDGEVIPRGQWASALVREGARVEVLGAIQGG